MFWGEYKDLRCPKLKKITLRLVCGGGNKGHFWPIVQTFHILTICDSKGSYIGVFS